MSATLASIVVNNYNYGRFLAEAIDSALAQTHRPLEVVVVDDGSTDESRDVISAYGDRIVPVLKENGGQASAFNAGFAASRGDVVLFLDADDALLPTAVEQAVGGFRNGTVKVHWPLWEIDEAGRRTGGPLFADVPEGDLREVVLRDGPASHVNPPTSGNAWTRAFLERVMPLPVDGRLVWADAYLLELAPLFGPLARVSEPLTLYRVHGDNRYASISFEERLRRGLSLYDLICEAMARYAQELGLPLELAACRRKSWFHRLERAVDEIAEFVPQGEPFVLLDQDEWGTDEELAGRRRFLFPERDGLYWGAPADDDEALAELARHCATWVVVGWPAFWWLDHYAGLRDHLDRHGERVLENERLVVFRLEA